MEGSTIMRDVNVEIKIQWDCTKCGTRNVYMMHRIDIHPKLDSTYRQPCCLCQKQVMSADMRVWEEAP